MSNPSSFQPTATTTDEVSEFDGSHSVVVHVNYPNAGVDRPRIYGIGFRANTAGRKLAARFAAAVEAGAVMTDATIETDVNGRTYVSATSRVMGKYANADLKRLGF